MFHQTENQGVVRALARDVDGEIAAANVEIELQPNAEFYVAGGAWEQDSASLTAFVSDATGQIIESTVAGADALTRRHMQTTIGAGGAASEASPLGFFKGEIAEILVFNRVLTQEDRERVIAYLRGRVGQGDAVELGVGDSVLHLHEEGIVVEEGKVVRWNDASGKKNSAVLGRGVIQRVAASNDSGIDVLSFEGGAYLEIGPNPKSFDGPALTWFYAARPATVSLNYILNSSYANIKPDAGPPTLARIQYNNPGLIVDVGVGLFSNPLPLDVDDDGRNDLIVVSNGQPGVGTYWFKPTDKTIDGVAIYQPGINFAPKKGGLRTTKTADGEWVVVGPGTIYPRADLAKGSFERGVAIDYTPDFWSRSSQWTLADWDADGDDDLLISTNDWREYGWDNAFNEEGEWTLGPLHGYVYWVENIGTQESPRYGESRQVMAGDGPIDTRGLPAPCFADFSGDGLPDLICGEFLDTLTFYENIGTLENPKFAPARPLEHNGQPMPMELQIMMPAAVDWDQDGDVDLVMGEEDGRVSLIRHTGRFENGLPVFEPPKYFQQEAHEIKVGALSSPTSTDWDNDGDMDLLVGDTAGFISLVENLGGQPIKWNKPVRLEAGGETLRIQAGYNGSIQGPAEAKWGYTVLDAADWNHDGLTDVIVNNINGRILWYENIGTPEDPELAAAQPVLMEWLDGKPHKPDWFWWTPENDEFVTQWRCSVIAKDLTGDGRLDLVTLDQDGYLALFESKQYDGVWKVSSPQYIFQMKDGEPAILQTKNQSGQFRDVNENGVNDYEDINEAGETSFYQPARWNVEPRPPYFTKPAVHAEEHELARRTRALRVSTGYAGWSGRRKFDLVDWDMDGRLDVVFDGYNATWMRNVAENPGEFVLTDMGSLDERNIGGHSRCPTFMDLDGNGSPDLVLGVEDGFLYRRFNPHKVPE